jgi:hypothetical protein
MIRKKLNNTMIEEDYEVTVRRIRDEFYEETKNMTLAERRKLIQKGADEFHQWMIDPNRPRTDITPYLNPPKKKRKQNNLKTWQSLFSIEEQQQIKSDARREGMSVRDYIRQRILEYKN